MCSSDLPAAMAALDLESAFVLVPPYRPALLELLAPITHLSTTVAGPMALPLIPHAVASAWIDGLDSV